MEEKCEQVLWKKGEPTIPLYYRSFINNKENDTLIIYFHGAISGPSIDPRIFPYFNGISIARETKNANFLLFSDPLLSLKEDILLTWYCSPYAEETISKKIAEIISSNANKYNIKKILLMGGSGAGIIISKVSQHLKGVYCFIWNCQTDISKFEFAKGEQKRLWAEAVSYPDPNISHNSINITSPQLYKNSNYYFILQLYDDWHHLEEHFTPLCLSLGESKNNINKNYSKNILPNVLVHVGNWATKEQLSERRSKHIAISREDQVNFLNDFISSKEPEKDFNTVYFNKWNKT